MNTEELKQYLERIGLREQFLPQNNPPLTGETLSRIQSAQLAAIPYENLDLLRGIPLKLSPEALFDKLVLRQRGGYCFEVNGLMADALRAMGFLVTEYAARMLLGKTEVQARRHRVLRVHAEDGDFLCDAGMNREMQRIALRMEPGLVQSDGVSEYRLEQDKFFGWMLYQRLAHHEFWPVYAFTEEPQTDLDYEMPSFWCEKHPDSPLNKVNRISIVRGTEHFSMFGDELVLFADGTVQERRPVAKEDQPALFAELFGIQG
ncbi:MAG: arylamine N-acetyltransferase family protein [Acutalibacteraceae bacterium]